MPSYTTRQTKSGTVIDVRFRIWDENGAEINKRLCGFPNKRKAQQAYLDFMKDYVPPATHQKKEAKQAYDAFFMMYRKKIEAELAPASLYDVDCIFEKFITPYFTGKSLADLKKADYVEWQTTIWSMRNPRTDKYYSQDYLKKIRSFFMSFLTWCEETFDIPNLYKSVRKPNRKEMKSEMKIWELKDFLHFQETVDDVLWKTFFMCLFYSGCRVGEVVALSDADVYRVNGVYCLNINKTLSRKTMQTDDKFVISAPKTATSNRTVALPQVMSDQIEQYIAYKAAQGISGKFFFGGDAPIPQRTYQRYFNTYTAKAELPHIRIHDLRHSHASMLIHLNVPITVISKRLGHSSIKMTLEKYAHCYSDGGNVALAAIDDAVCGTKDGTN